MKSSNINDLCYRGFLLIFHFIGIIEDCVSLFAY